jgi:hypothetical protein
VKTFLLKNSIVTQNVITIFIVLIITKVLPPRRSFFGGGRAKEMKMIMGVDCEMK